MAWSTSTRRGRLPADWPAIRAQVKARARGRCQGQDVLAPGQVAHHPDCDGRGTDADHITPGDDHTLPNLQWLSTPCHRAKTSREAADRNRARAAMRKRPPETHPGALP